MSAATTPTRREIACYLKSGGMRCNCDLDNWEPTLDTGHSHVCRIHVAAIGASDALKTEVSTALAEATASRIVSAGAFRFPNVSCSQCGCDFGPGDSGFSDCREHQGRPADLDRKADEAIQRGPQIAEAMVVRLPAGSLS